MLGNVFVDTNILLYAKFNDDGKKFQVANDLFRLYLHGKQPFISTQVVNEFCVNAVKMGGDPFEIRSTVANFANRFHIMAVSMNTVRESFRIYDRYQFSHWDCLIAASAIESDCEVLFTEDLSDGQILDGTLQIINPFKHYGDIIIPQ
ncbi:twitching motility protein PilT [Spirochaetia bacterium]|nr:twitching motility protein PilT [Spirochaetia bacterium]